MKKKVQKGMMARNEEEGSEGNAGTSPTPTDRRNESQGSE